MSTNILPPRKKNTANTLAGQMYFIASLLLIVFLCFVGCYKDSSITSPKKDDLQQLTFESTGEEFLISALDEVESIAELVQHTGISMSTTANLNSLSALLPPKSQKKLISSNLSDTTYIYGEVTSDGYGAVVTEKHAYPKGILLITVRKSYGRPATRVVTETKRYITYQDFLNDTSQQSNVTEVYGLSSDTLVTHVNRNGTVETYTFRLPVITRVTNSVDGSVRVTTRYGMSGKVRSEIRDGSGNLVQLRETYGDSTGALTTYTEYADSSWRKVCTIGRADGSVYHETTSGS